MIEELKTLWQMFEPAHDFIYSVCITLTTAFLLFVFRPRVNLVWGSTSANFHQFPVSEEGNTAAIWTEKFYVQNMGRKPARDIEIVFNVPPTSYNLWPPREHAKTILENSNFVLKIPSIAPNELLIVDMIDMYSQQVNLIAVNCPDAVTKSVKFAATRQFGTMFNAIIGYLMAAGFLGTVYFLLKLFAPA